MAKYVFEVSLKGMRASTASKIADRIKELLSESATVTHREVKVAESRQERFEEAKGQLEDAKTQLEELRDELQGWYDNLPENLQSGAKADELQEAIDGLESAIDQAEEAAGVDVAFPSMF